MLRIGLGSLLTLTLAGSLAQAAVPSKPALSAATPEAPKAGEWLLKPFLKMAAQDPDRLLKLGRNLYATERLEQAKKDPKLAYEWQHRLAYVQSLTDFYHPQSRVTAAQRGQARELIELALTEDPSLLVRDGAAESIRRVMAMQPGSSKEWRAMMEKAFLQPKNIRGGEGLFIRETILTAMAEASMRPSAKMWKAAKNDQNAQVRDLLKQWRSDAYDSIK